MYHKKLESDIRCPLEYGLEAVSYTHLDRAEKGTAE